MTPDEADPAAGGASDPAHNLPELSVSDLSRALKRTVEEAFGRVRVRGEISQPKVAGSGHCYLRLKDDSAVLDGVIWKGTMARLALRPEDGLEVIATGRLTTYGGRSSYQIVIESLDLAGEGALLKLLEDRRRRLAAEGLFAAERKRPIPFMPRIIGVVTSPTGAVIRDILHRLNDRFPVHVLVWPARVQGEDAAAEITAAIEGFNALAPGGLVPRPDVVIVARGGGSLDDLMAFNDEAVVRAAAASAIPLVSAVGHETDTTLIDHAADLRAPTPSGAAEMVVPVRLDLLARVGDDGRRLVGAAARLLDDRAARLTGLARGLPDVARLVEDLTQRLDDRARRLALAGPAFLERRAAEVAHLAARLRGPRELLTIRAGELGHLARSLDGAAMRLLEERARALATTGARLRPDPLSREAERRADAMARAGSALDTALRRRLDDAEARLEGRGHLLESYSFRKVLARGFALVRDAGSDRPLTVATDTAPGQALALEFADGRVTARVDGDAASAPDSRSSREDASGPTPARKTAGAGRRGAKGADPRQGTLLDGL